MSVQLRDETEDNTHKPKLQSYFRPFTIEQIKYVKLLTVLYFKSEVLF